VPRTCAVRQARDAWRQPQAGLPLCVEQPGRTRDEVPRRWHGHRVIRPVEGAASDGRGALAALRFVVVHASPLAQPPTQASTAAPANEAAAVLAHVKPVHARWLACEAEAAAAIAA
jgi:CelD/BcsL family acetyltransferase involved in cellulose biosynthesis